MNASPIIYAVLLLSYFVADAAADVRIIRPGPCASPYGSYLLTANSGAIIKVEEDGNDPAETSVIVFRRDIPDGWASRRLLSRFDLKLDPAGPTILNSGAFCVGER